MTPGGIFEDIRNHFGKAGFNLTVKIASRDYDNAARGKKSGELLPGARSIILTGFAGRDFWETFNLFLVRNPGFIGEHENPIDDYTREVFGELSAGPVSRSDARWVTVFPFGEGALDLDFVRLGILGGVGVPSLLGLLLNPIFGTWISLRGAIITDAKFNTYDAPIEGFEPCPACDKPCISACPAHTISVKGWDWEACMRHRISTDICSDKCASRLACPYGNEHAYPAGQIAHHHKYVLKSVKKYFAER
ncbi:MAG TPA: hypothetical protein VHC46_03265 [Thermodesulfobacteriota bacterium]|nr:hypothetical protein [Thermodesulfobacteriota bacterium]